MARGLELLAPARDAETGRQAILHGADAVYIGGPSHGARVSATNSIAEIAQLAEFAHLYGAKVYVTLNTIIYDEEIDKVQATIRELYEAQVDALIVQDMAVLRMDIPPIDLHASTQCDIRTPEKAKFLSQCGFSQIVVARELSVDQVRQIRQSIDPEVKIEAFVHGALCVSYSGDCQASCVAKGRSANRGECAQMCRLPYTLTDAQGNVIIRDKHLLSLRDLNRLPDIQTLADAGVSSFKIEGRLKDASYVKNTVAAYRQAIDRVIAANPDKYKRASYGKSMISFTADVNKSFNRGFTSYFTHGRPTAAIKMANIDTPKWVGEEVGVIKACQGNVLIAKLSKQLSNGDGIGYYSADGEFAGFRLNRIDGDRLYPATPIQVPAGTVIYRNHDTKHEAMMSQRTAQRLIDTDMTLSREADTLRLTLTAESGISVTVAHECSIEQARTPQKETRRRALAKLGGTPLNLKSLTDDIAEDAFIPASTLTTLRQKAVAELQTAIIGSHRRATRRSEDAAAKLPHTTLTYHDNVANRLAERLYRDHGATEIERAIETQGQKPKSGMTVMTTRYCLRRELGACLCTAQGKKLPTPLYLHSDTDTYRLDFDCKACQMKLVTT